MRYLSYFLPVLLCTTLSAQKAKYIGLENVDVSIRPEFTLHSGNLYLETFNGLYSRPISSTTNTWTSLSANLGPCGGYVFKGDSILITTAGGPDSCIYLSTNKGQTWKNFTNGFGGSRTDFIDPLELAQDPIDPSSIYGMAGDCVAKSTDFGRSWNPVKNSWGFISYQPVILKVNPLRKDQVMSGGEAGNFHSYLDISINAGNTWSQHAVEDNNAVNCLEFHPTNPAIMYIGKEGKIDRSIDSGKTWQTTYIPPELMYIYAISQPSSEAVYATGAYNNVGFAKDTLHIFRSSNDGKTWNKYHEEYIPNCGGGAEMAIYDSIAYVLTWNKGVFTIDLRNLPTSIHSTKKSKKFIINHRRELLTISSADDAIFTTGIYTTSGRLIFKETAPKNLINTATWATGVYIVNVQSRKGRMTSKILVSH